LNAEIFDSSVRSLGDLGGVFEYDGETAYFYLLDHQRAEGQTVVDAIHITSKQPDFGKDDVRVEWDTSETKVGLLIKRELWAAFEADGKKYGGNYQPGARPNIPDAVAESFRTE
jgi:hypothetical protein